MIKKALITGIFGQDSHYLSELLLNKGYEVYGMVRHIANRKLELNPKIKIYSASLESYPSIYKMILDVKPDEVYHLAAISYVSYSFEDEFSTFNTNFNGTHYLLSAIKDLCPKCKFYFAGTSEMYGNSNEKFQNEDTPFRPVSPYGISKLAGFNLVHHYRNLGLKTYGGILFNHTSPHRGVNFASRKITLTAARIAHSLTKELRMGNLDAKRDFGFAGDYVEAMWLMLQKEPDDYVIATGEAHSIKEIVEIAFKRLGLNYKKYLIIDPKFYRPAELHYLRGDASKADKVLGWKPKKKFKQIIEEMVDYDFSHSC